MIYQLKIQKINLYLSKEANINYIDRISIFQEFTPLNDSIYFLYKDKFYADFKILGKSKTIINLSFLCLLKAD